MLELSLAFSFNVVTGGSDGDDVLWVSRALTDEVCAPHYANVSHPRYPSCSVPHSVSKNLPKPRISHVLLKHFWHNWNRCLALPQLPCLLVSFSQFGSG